MEHEGTSLCSQEPTTGPYPEPMNAVHTLTPYLFKIYLNIILPCIPNLPSDLLPSRFLIKILNAGLVSPNAC
jgi:hypothetical protein